VYLDLIFGNLWVEVADSDFPETEPLGIPKCVAVRIRHCMYLRVMDDGNIPMPVFLRLGVVDVIRLVLIIRAAHSWISMDAAEGMRRQYLIWSSLTGLMIDSLWFPEVGPLLALSRLARLLPRWRIAGADRLAVAERLSDVDVSQSINKHKQGEATAATTSQRTSRQQSSGRESQAALAVHAVASVASVMTIDGKQRGRVRVPTLVTRLLWGEWLRRCLLRPLPCCCM
jgi:hypothetical protein